MEVGGLISQLRAGSVGQRSAAAERLGELGGRAAVDALAEGLKAEPGSVGSAAALALARIGDDLATERLVDGASRQGPARHRMAAAVGLGELARRDAVHRAAAIDALTLTLDSDDFSLAHEAVEALASLDDDRALDALLAAVRGERSATARSTATRYLADSAAASGRRAPDALAALAAAMAQGDAGWGAAQALAKLPGGVDVLLGEFEQADRERRYSAVTGLGASGDRRAATALVEALADDALVAGAAAHALGTLGDPRAVPALRHALGGEAGWPAAQVLAGFGPEGIRALVDASADADHGVRGVAIHALHTLGEAATEPLTMLLGGTADEAIAAARAAGELRLGDTRDALAAAAGSRAPELRVAALDALTRVGAPARAPKLLECLSDDEPEIRAAGARALATAPPAEDASAGALARLLDDGDAAVRAAAAGALADLEAGPGHEASLLRLLDDDDSGVRAAAARALRGGDPRAALDPLLDALADPVHDVRGAAAGALARLGDDPLQPLAARLADPRKEVRDAAALALGEIGETAYADLYTALESDDVLRRAAATAALARAAVDDHNPLVTVLDLLHDESTEVRRQALLGLGRLPPPRMPAEFAEHAIARIAEMLGGDDASLREAAAQALLVVGALPEDRYERGAGAEVAARLADALTRGPLGVRRATAGAIAAELGRLAPAQRPFPGWFWVSRETDVIHVGPWVPALVSALADAAEDPDPLVREPARSALADAHAALAAKRSGAAVIDEHVRYFTAPESNLGSPLPEEQLAEVVATASPPERPPRYADVTLLRDGAPLPEHDALRENEKYELEVAVRRVRTGLHMQAEPAPFVEPDAAETLDVLVVVDADGVDVEPSLGWLKLPPQGDSVEHPRFPLQARRPSGSEAARAEITIRLYHGFNLLESLRIRAEIVSRLRPGLSSQLGLERPVTLEQDRIARGFAQLEQTEPRAMHIDVEQADGVYRFRFTMPGPDEHELVLAGGKRLSVDYLESRLVRLRVELDKLALGAPYATEVEGSKVAFHDALVTLATIGRELWTDLFRSDPHSSLWKIGEWIEANPPPPESVIQVSLDASAGDLVFPWSFIYDRPLPERGYEDPDPEGFWGIRYIVEQQAPGRQPGGADTLRRADGPLSLAYMLWSQFPNAAAHSEAIARLGAREPCRALVSRPPVETPSACVELMQDEEPEDVLYFFAHGSTRRPATALGLDSRDLLLKIYGSLPKYVREDASVRQSYEQLAEEGSWLKLTYGTLKLGSLKELSPDAIAPLVVLNTCDSAQLIPSFGDDSFVTFFLGWGARTVIGTECRMTVHFAHPFAEALLDAVLDGSSFGVALLRTRRRFVEARNPLALAYTLYGSASAGFGPALQPTGGST